MDNTHNPERRLIEAIQKGLPLVSRPYAAIGKRIGMSETEVITRLSHLIENGTIKRLGVVVRHRQLGYNANAMVVWDIPDEQVTPLGKRLGQIECVTLCYHRARHLPDWPYNLYCMIHGKDRQKVLDKLEGIIQQCDLTDRPHQVLFSRHCFKQRGAIYTVNAIADTPICEIP
ncbi:MAG: AsnC family protein [Candidatus Parabeggiatoa sp. nov. 3]|nr:MAG: AsnC family protein [Gammaproteobacteria bacterium]RKZ69666.1 MAG: AsnC family protein [Gammaproteobacteria bacterium]RKZ88081.1 MAG: AsnC family protein [Gammaproteobacteria bacterium]